VSADETPKVSVIVPTFNRADLLVGCLANLLAQDYPPESYEILVADDGSRDDTSVVLARHVGRSASPRVRYLPLPHRGPNASRNAALRVSSNDLLCFVDDDVRAPMGWLSAMVEGVQRHPDAACFGGPMRLRWQGKMLRHCGSEPFGESELDLGDSEREVELVHSGNMALRRRVLDRVGEFRETRLPGLDEVELIERLIAARLAVVYVPQAWVWHLRTAEQCRLRSLMGRRFVRGIGQARALDSVGRGYRLRWEYQSMRGALRHAVSSRCSWGLVQAAHAAGRLTGSVECAIRRQFGMTVS
jgi:glycosyltransferase involved in cell wall biosynthesis